MRAALVSFDPVWEDKEKNKRACELFVVKAAEYHCDIIIFPEMTLTGYSMNPKAFAEDVQDSPTINFFCNLASFHEISIVFGVILHSGYKYENHAVICSSGEKVLASYAKISIVTWNPGRDNSTCWDWRREAPTTNSYGHFRRCVQRLSPTS